MTGRSAPQRSATSRRAKSHSGSPRCRRRRSPCRAAQRFAGPPSRSAATTRARSTRPTRTPSSRSPTSAARRTRTGLASVYDGHGKTGDKCSQFAREHLPAQFVAAAGPAGRLPGGCAIVHAAMAHAHERTNEMLRASTQIDDTLSGTTATSVYLDGAVDGGRIVVANVGDSKTIIASVPAAHHSLTDTTVGLKVTALSSEHTPFIKEERERIKQYGGTVCSNDQLDGNELPHEDWRATASRRRASGAQAATSPAPRSNRAARSPARLATRSVARSASSRRPRSRATRSPRTTVCSW